MSTQTTVQNALLECFDNDRSFGSEREGKTLCRTCSYILELNNASGRESCFTMHVIGFANSSCVDMPYISFTQTDGPNSTIPFASY